jgi:membrane peptidoglycan carboxypeptidase
MISLSDTARRDAKLFFRLHGEDAGKIFAALLAAEDRRAMLHNGIDWISIARAIVLYPRRRRLNGISTIEQQYARTVVRRSGVLWRCKLRELRAARALAKTVTKEEIWAAYLFRAYFGAYITGYTAARRFFVPNGGPISWKGAAQIVSCLKYPRPKFSSLRWHSKHQSRVEYLLLRLQRNSVADVRNSVAAELHGRHIPGVSRPAEPHIA